MKNYVLALLLALLVVLSAVSLRRTVVSIGTSPMPLPPPKALGIGTSPMPLPPPKALGIGTSPMPLPPPKALGIGTSPTLLLPTDR